MKKIVSIIIAMTLILSLCPLTFAADTGDAFDGYEYVFTAEAISSSSKVTSFASKTYDSIVSDISDKWEMACKYYAKTVEVYPEKNSYIHGGFVVPIGDYCVNNPSNAGYMNACFGIKINVAEGGTYLPALKYYARESAPIVDVYLVKKGTQAGTLTTDDLSKDAVVKNINYIKNLDDTYKIGTVDMWADSVDADGKETLVETTEYFGNISRQLEAGDYYLLFHAVGYNEKFAAYNHTSYNNVAMIGVNSFSLTPEPEEDQALTNAFDAIINNDVSYTAPTVTGVTVDGGVIKSSESDDGTFTLTADAEKNGNKFLYWAKGKTLGKKIISFSNELTNYMPEANDKNHILIAVYEGDVPEQEEWYNANGQRIATGTEPDTYPSMAGYGTAEGWDDYTDKIHVARYARQTPTEGIKVTVEGENTSGGGTNLTYGDTVTCTATGENFKCWTKTGINGNTEIVSVDKTYKFQAWEDCTVTAIYDEDYTYNGNTMKIILDVFDAGNEKAVMAEFIGFGNSAVEKGIIWNGTKIAMTKPGTQFILTGDAGDTFTGYAIVDNGDENYSEVTDGSITIAE